MDSLETKYGNNLSLEKYNDRCIIRKRGNYKKSPRNSEEAIVTAKTIYQEFNNWDKETKRELALKLLTDQEIDKFLLQFELTYYPMETK